MKVDLDWTSVEVVEGKGGPYIKGFLKSPNTTTIELVTRESKRENARLAIAAAEAAGVDITDLL